MTSTPPSPTPSPTSANAKARLAKIDPVPKPDVEGLRAAINAENEAIRELRKKAEALSIRISERQGGQQEYNRKKDEIRKKLDDYTMKVERLEEERKRLIVAIDEMQRSGRDMKTKVQGLKRDLGFNTEEEIDRRIRDIEHHMLSNRTSVQEERALMSQMQQLKKSKPLVGKYATMETNANSYAQNSVVPLRTRFDESKEELRLLQQKKREESEKLKALVDQRQSEFAPVKDIFDERDALRKQIAEHRQQQDQLRDQMEAKLRAYQAYTAEVKAAKEDILREDRKKRAADQERADLEQHLLDLGDASVTPEGMRLQQLSTYLSKLIERYSKATNSILLNDSCSNNSSLIGGDSSPSKSSSVSSSGGGRQQVVTNGLSNGVTTTNGVNNNNNSDNGGNSPNGINGLSNGVKDDDGMVRVKPKHDRDEYFIPPSKSKNNSKNQKKKSGSKHQPLVHDIRTLSDFEEVRINPPLTLDDCPRCLKEISKRLEVVCEEQKTLNAEAARRREIVMSKLEALNKREAKVEA